jgi:oligoendopeptidase F
MSDVMIRVPAEVRDQLAAVAEARGTSLRALMQDIAAQTLTPEQIKERADRTRALLAERFGHDVTDAESAEMRRKMRAATAAHRAALAEAEAEAEAEVDAEATR